MAAERLRRDVEPRRTAEPPRAGAVVADDAVAGARHGVDHRDAPPAAAVHRPGPGGPAALGRVPAAAGEPAGLGRRGSVGLEEQQGPAAVEQDRRPDAERAPGRGVAGEIGAVGRGHAGTRARRER